jgi:hypothetical protein
MRVRFMSTDCTIAAKSRGDGMYPEDELLEPLLLLPELLDPLPPLPLPELDPPPLPPPPPPPLRFHSEVTSDSAKACASRCSMEDSETSWLEMGCGCASAGVEVRSR